MLELIHYEIVRRGGDPHRIGDRARGQKAAEGDLAGFKQANDFIQAADFHGALLAGYLRI
jgi:hypothetical protein